MLPPMIAPFCNRNATNTVERTAEGKTAAWRTAEEAWAEFVRKAEGAGGSPWWIAQCRIAFETNQPPWCWEEYLPESMRPTANDKAVAAAIAEIIAENGGQSMGEQPLRPLLEGKLPGRRITQKQLRRLKPKAPRLGRPPKLR